MKVVLVAEAWGRHESQFQHPLVGPSGRELTLQIAIGGLGPYMTLLCRKCKTQTRFISHHCEHCKENIWPNEFDLIEHWKRLRSDYGIAVTNVFNMQPPDNDLGHFFGSEAETPMPSWKASKKTGGSHLKAEHFHHVKRLWRELADLKPNLVVAMGNASCWALLGETKITTLRGTVAKTNTELNGLDLKTLPIFHPAAILHQPPMRVSSLADMAKAAREAEFPEIRRPERWIRVVAPNASGIREGYDWLQEKPIAKMANDIETIRQQISVVGVSRSVSEALVIPIRDAKTKNNKLIEVGWIAERMGFPRGQINYWPTAELEVEAWKLIIKIEESSIPKIFQNGVYDLSYFIRMGIHPKNCQDDTMLFHHSEYPELPKSLGYLGSIYANEVAWKNMARSDSLKRDE